MEVNAFFSANPLYIT